MQESGLHHRPASNRGRRRRKAPYSRERQLSWRGPLACIGWVPASTPRSPGPCLTVRKGPTWSTAVPPFWSAAQGPNGWCGSASRTARSPPISDKTRLSRLAVYLPSEVIPRLVRHTAVPTFEGPPFGPSDPAAMSGPTGQSFLPVMEMPFHLRRRARKQSCPLLPAPDSASRNRRNSARPQRLIGPLGRTTRWGNPAPGPAPDITHIQDTTSNDSSRHVQQRGAYEAAPFPHSEGSVVGAQEGSVPDDQSHRSRTSSSAKGRPFQNGVVPLTRSV